MTLFKLASRNVKRNLRRSILSGSCITISIIVISFFMAFMNGMKKDLTDNTINYAAGEIRIRNLEFAENERFNPIQFNIDHADNVVASLEKLEGVKTILPRIYLPGQPYIASEKSNHSMIGIGIDFAKETPYLGLDKGALIEGELPSSGKRQAMIGSILATDLGLKVGDSFTLLVQTASLGSNAMTFNVSGIFNFPLGEQNKNYFYTSLADAQKLMKMEALYGRSSRVQELLVHKNEGVVDAQLTSSLATTLQQMKEKGEVNFDAEILPWQKIATLGAVLPLFDIQSYFFLVIFLLLGSSVMISSMNMTVYERMNEIGILRAMGMTAKNVRRLFFNEGFIISLYSSVIGLIIGIFLAVLTSKSGINLGLDSTDLGISNFIYPQLDLPITFMIAFLSTLIAVLTSYIAIKRVAKIKVINAINAREK